MNLSRFSGVLATFYDDLMDIYRYSQEIAEDGTINYVLSTVPIYEKVPCRLSFKSMDEAITNNITHKPEFTQAKIFTKPSVDLVDGDVLHVTRRDNGNEYAFYKGTIGNPYKYPTHQEATFEEENQA